MIYMIYVFIISGDITMGKSSRDTLYIYITYNIAYCYRVKLIIIFHIWTLLGNHLQSRCSFSMRNICATFVCRAFHKCPSPYLWHRIIVAQIGYSNGIVIFRPQRTVINNQRSAFIILQFLYRVYTLYIIGYI